MEKLIIQPNEAGEFPKVITILEGEAATPLPLREPKVLNLNGVLKTPGDFVEKRRETFDKLEANVVANFTNRTIELTIDEKNYYSHKITGKLTENEELKTLGINNNKIYTENKLREKLTFYRRHFKSSDEYAKLLAALKKFNAKIAQEFVNEQNNQGSAKLQRAYEIKHEIPLQFTLEMPVFNGYEKHIFGVNINLQLADNTVCFWFESIDLHEKLETLTDVLMEGELARLNDYAIVRTY